MKIKIISRFNANIENNEMKIIVEYSENNKRVKDLLEYIKAYKEEIIVKDDNKLLKIPYKDIIIFFSKDKENYCKTKNKEYKIKSKLYELEKINRDFIRVSKKCIVNINHVERFDIGEIGKIIIKLDNGDIATVSRRKIRDVMDYLDERSI